MISTTKTKERVKTSYSFSLMLFLNFWATLAVVQFYCWLHCQRSYLVDSGNHMGVTGMSPLGCIQGQHLTHCTMTVQLIENSFLFFSLIGCYFGSHWWCLGVISGSVWGTYVMLGINLNCPHAMWVPYWLYLSGPPGNYLWPFIILFPLPWARKRCFFFLNLTFFLLIYNIVLVFRLFSGHL